MASTYAKIHAQKLEASDKRPTLMETLTTISDDPRYYVVIENGKILACGDVKSVAEQIPKDYWLREIKYSYYDLPRDQVKVVV